MELEGLKARNCLWMNTGSDEPLTGGPLKGGGEGRKDCKSRFRSAEKLAVDVGLALDHHYISEGEPSGPLDGSDVIRIMNIIVASSLVSNSTCITRTASSMGESACE